MVTSIICKHVVLSVNLTAAEEEFPVQLALKYGPSKSLYKTRVMRLLHAAWKAIEQKFNAIHCWILVNWVLTAGQIYGEIYVKLMVS